MEVKATKNGRTVTAAYNCGEDLEEMRKLFGDKIAFSNARQQIKIGIQGIMRRMIEADKSDKEIVDHVADYKPGLAGERQDPIQKFKTKWASLGKEDREKLLKELKSM